MFSNGKKMKTIDSLDIKKSQNKQQLIYSHNISKVQRNVYDFGPKYLSLDVERLFMCFAKH